MYRMRRVKSRRQVLDRSTSGIGSSEPPSDMISIIHYMMQEQKRRDEERRRDEEKREQQRCENERQRCLDEQRRQDMLTNQFERQMKLIFQHQEGQRITEQEFMQAQQLEIHAAQQEAAELNTQRQTFQAVLNRLPRLTSTTEVLPFFTGFEQTLVDNEVPEVKWHRAALRGQLAMEYWNTFTPQQRKSYPEAKKTLMAWLAFSETACLQQYSVTRMKWTESIQQAIHESTAHVDALLGNTPPECHG